MLVLVREMAEQHGKHVLLSSHLLPDVEQVCRHVIMLRRGRVAQQGRIHDLLSSELGAWLVTVRGDADAFRAALEAAGAAATGSTPLLVRLPAAAGTDLFFQAASQAGVQLRGLKPVRRSLEDVFLDAVEDRVPATVDGGGGAGGGTTSEGTHAR
jgi:ABC-2 type transport system ATP-binding protein